MHEYCRIAMAAQKASEEGVPFLNSTTWSHFTRVGRGRCGHIGIQQMGKMGKLFPTWHAAQIQIKATISLFSGPEPETPLHLNVGNNFPNITQVMGALGTKVFLPVQAATLQYRCGYQDESGIDSGLSIRYAGLFPGSFRTRP